MDWRQTEVWGTHSFGLGPAYGSLDERASSFDIGRELAKEAILVVNIAVLCYTSGVNVL